jgi:hypothetical protein
VEVYLVLPVKEKYLPYEGIYTDYETAKKNAKICNGIVEIVLVDRFKKFLDEGKEIFTTCVKLSTPEVIFTRAIGSIWEGGYDEEEDGVILPMESHPDDDRLYMYVWARNDEEAGMLALEGRKRNESP